MASTYTHYAFARDVLPKLPAAIQEVILNERQLYDIGCHGSDLFFYYHPLKQNDVSTFGHELHEKKATLFFADCIRVLKKRNYNRASLSYIFGFITHFALDSCVHGYVERKAQSHSDEDFDHGTIEVEFDRYLLVKEEKDPIRTSLIKHIVASKRNASIIAGFFPNVGYKKTKVALNSIIFFNNILNAPSKLKRQIVYFLLKKLGKYDSLRSQLISFDGDSRCIETNKELQKRYDKAIPVAVKLIKNFNAVLKTTDPLDNRFNKSFSWEDND